MAIEVKKALRAFLRPRPLFWTGVTVLAVIAIYTGLSAAFPLGLPLAALAGSVVAALVVQTMAGARGGALTVIRAQVPMDEMLTYEQHLTSATSGRGSYHMEFSHYEEVPHQLQGKIISAAKAERGQEVAEEV